MAWRGVSQGRGDPRGSAISAVAALTTFAGRRDREQRAALRLHERALGLVTHRDVAPRRLGPTPGLAPKAHGNDRGDPGVDLAVRDLSTWRPHHPDLNTGPGCPMEDAGPGSAGGSSEPTGATSSIAEGPELAKPPDRLRVTRAFAPPARASASGREGAPQGT
jgi:hypothetical protein